MSDSELNKWLHENVMGECWHGEMDIIGRNGDRLYSCTKCSKEFYTDSPEMPKYCNSLDAVAKVEAKVIADAEDGVYLIALGKVVVKNGRNWSVTATARERAEACKEAWKSK